MANLSSYLLVYFSMSPLLHVASKEQIAALVNTYLEKHPLAIPPMRADVLGGAKLGENLKMSEDGRLCVDTADTADATDIRPITAAAVHSLVGDIGSMLDAL